MVHVTYNYTGLIFTCVAFIRRKVIIIICVSLLSSEKGCYVVSEIGGCLKNYRPPPLHNKLTSKRAKTDPLELRIYINK